MTMIPEHWQQVKRVLEKVPKLAPELRSAYLDQACTANSSLRNEIESLLLADAEAGSSFLQSLPVEASSEAKAYELIGQTLGHTRPS